METGFQDLSLFQTAAQYIHADGDFTMVAEAGFPKKQLWPGFKTVPPIRSGFPDHGPDPDFFEEIGPDLVQI